MFKKFSSILSLLLFLIAVDEALFIFSVGIGISNFQTAVFLGIVDILGLLIFIIFKFKRKNFTLNTKATAITQIVIGGFDFIFYDFCVVFSMLAENDADGMVSVIFVLLGFGAFGVIQIASGCLKLSRLKKEKRLLSPHSIAQSMTPAPSVYPDVMSDEPTTSVPENKNTFNDTTKLKRISSKQKKIIGGIVGAVAVAGIVTGIAHAKIRSDQEAQRQAVNEYNMYLDHVSQLYAETLSGARTSESVCVLTYNVWCDRIYEQYSDDETAKYVKNTSDFNEAIDNLYEDAEIKDKLSSIRSSQDDAQALMQKLQSVPDNLDKCYEAALNTYTSFELLAELALQPTGTLNSYKESETSYVASYLEAQKTLLAVIPEKKDIPCFDEEDTTLIEDLYFANYLGQPFDNVVKSEDLGDKVVEYNDRSLALDAVEINGITGLAYFLGEDGMIDHVSWNSKSSDENKFNELLSFLTKLYGEPNKLSEGKYAWSSTGTHATISLEFTDGISISWLYICACE